MKMDKPIEFRGCIFDNGWEYDAPCVIYRPWRYRRYGIGSNNGEIDSMVEDICADIMEGKPHRDGGLVQECEWRGWSPRGFRRRQRAEHVIIHIQWGLDGKACIISRKVYMGPPPRRSAP